MVFITNIVKAQEDSTVTVAADDEEGKLPVRYPWTTSMLIDNQTTETPNAQTFEFAIHHRFGKISGMSDLFGIYAASNIRLGVTYGITKKIAIGFGTEKDHKLQEFQGKYKIISQSRNGKIPLSLTYFGNIVIDGREKEFFGKDYKFPYRLSYFHQIIAGRKITSALSAEAAFSYSHFNLVTETVVDPRDSTIGKWKNDYLGVMLGGRYNFYNNMSAIIEYCQPFSVNKVWDGQSEPLPSLGLGLEIGTGTHAFQLFASNYRSIIAQENYSHNLNEMGDGDDGWFFGFNIVIRL
jgi:predicted porin